MSLVPYAAQELAKPQNAALAADLFYEAGKAAHGMYASYKSRPKKKGRTAKRKFSNLADLGHSPTKLEARRVDRQSGVVAVSNKELFTEELIRIDKNVAADEAINKRSRDVIHHRGVKICMSFKNTLKVPIFINWAIVVPKSANSISGFNILRSNGVDRDVTLNNALTFMDLNCLPINTDLYRVVKKKKILIQPDSNKSATASEGNDFRMIEEYVKTNRKIYFDGSSSTPLQNMHMVWWCDYYNSPTGASATTMQVDWRIVSYFNDVP